MPESDLAVKAIINTIIKRLTLDSTDIDNPNEKFDLPAGEEIEINWFRTAKTRRDHWEFELQSPHGNFYNWFAFKTHIEINGIPLKDTAPISSQRQAFLDMISVPEGTSSSDGYRICFTGKVCVPANFSAHPRQIFRSGRLVSNAAGRYQFLSSTWDMCQQALELPDFSPASQDRAAIFLIKRRGALGDVDAGRVSKACEKVSWEWASIPYNEQGEGRYGQPTIELAKAKQLFKDFGGVLAAGE